MSVPHQRSIFIHACLFTMTIIVTVQNDFKNVMIMMSMQKSHHASNNIKCSRQVWELLVATSRENNFATIYYKTNLALVIHFALSEKY